MSEVIQNFWASEASKWSLQNKNPLVGWYTEHNEDPREEELLFRGVPVKVNSLALEYGCGPGRNIIKFKDWFQQIDGADISKDILEKVHINLAEANVPLPNLFHIDGVANRWQVEMEVRALGDDGRFGLLERVPMNDAASHAERTT